MKVVLIFDQGLAGAGGKTNPHQGLALEKGGVGSAFMLKPHFEKIGANIVATLYCGNEFFLENKEEVVKKMALMVKKINPDIVLCGPCFDFKDYALMSAMITKEITDTSDIVALAMMSKENEEVINEYRNKITILKMPKKGGTGLSDSFEDLSDWMLKKSKNEDMSEIEKEIRF